MIGVGDFTEFDSLIERYFDSTTILSISSASSANADRLNAAWLNNKALAILVSLNFNFVSPVYVLFSWVFELNQSPKIM